MTVEKGRLFSIGQFAALHGVNKKTLMWYDEIGLFCPAVCVLWSWQGRNGSGRRKIPQVLFAA